MGHTLLPVSYTHLDVYKRQANYFKPQEFEVSNCIVDAVILLEEGETTAFCSALTSFLADIPYDCLLYTSKPNLPIIPCAG